MGHAAHEEYGRNMSNFAVLNQMRYGNTVPVIFQILRHQAAVAVLRLLLAAQQTSLMDDIFCHRFFNGSLCHAAVYLRLIRGRQ